MIKYLINRPIAVLMTTLALVILGIICTFQIPVSLLPQIEIPEIIVQVNYKNANARQLEESIVKPIRNQLQQISHLSDIVSATNDGFSLITMRFQYGTNMNFAYIEANEKLDLLLPYLPHDMERPRIIKKNASDIPIFTLSVFQNDSMDSKPHFQLSEFCESVIRKRLEQLDEVSMVDISGLENKELVIIPDFQKLQQYNISLYEISKAIQENNTELGNVLIKDGKLVYHIHYSGLLTNKNKIDQILIKKGNRIFKLADIAFIDFRAQNTNGSYLFNGKRAVCFNVIKQPNAQMGKLNETFNNLIDELKKENPDLNFIVNQNQAELLSISIDNLKGNLIVGSILTIIIMIFFLKNLKTPLIIAISVPVSLVISMFFLYILNVSINIVSLAGLILAVGNMIDNSIIVIDNITQRWEENNNLELACTNGTNEVMAPLFSGVITNCLIFVPLIFLSGIAGSLFTDQAITVTVGLFASYFTGIIVIPVLFFIFYRNNKQTKSLIIEKFNLINYERYYDTSLSALFKRKKFTLLCFFLLIPLGYFLGSIIKKEEMPQIPYSDAIITIDWNTNISIEENENETKKLLKKLHIYSLETNCYIGQQQFLIANNDNFSFSETRIYVKANNDKQLDSVKNFISQYFIKNYPYALYHFSNAPNAFEMVFNSSKSPLVANISPFNNSIPFDYHLADTILKTSNYIELKKQLQNIPIKEYYEAELIYANIANYNLEINDVINTLKSIFDINYSGYIYAMPRVIPIIIGSNTRQTSLNKILKQTSITNINGEAIPLHQIIKLQKKLDLKTIFANKTGEFVPISISANSNNYKEAQMAINTEAQKTKLYNVNYAGSIIENSKLLKEFFVIFLISIFLLYIILAAQFESLFQPIIILLEIPFNIAGGLFLLIIAQNSLNVMSIIGFVVMAGIVLNDSILKIDTINSLRKNGYTLDDAIHLAGKKRIRSILMSALTSVLAFVPLFFTTGLGVELQKPFALTLIGSMVLGTIVSIYFIPIVYWFIYKNK